jgi:hypothetical protein
MTGNTPEQVLTLYRLAYERMQEAGFDLGSWSSNCDELVLQFKRDGRATEHGTSHEKLLGYQYLPREDKLTVVVDNNLACSVTDTKRFVLSRIAKVFDPLGLVGPITVRCKILLRELWKAKIDWDDEVPDHLKASWSKLSSDLAELNKWKFQRKAFVTDEDISLIVFTDASQQLYGFTVYAVYKEGDEIKSTLLFAKSKVAPLNKKSLPTLELLGVYLALKCLPQLLTALGHSKIKEVSFGIDSQIVLSWILSGFVKSKNVFASNRVKDITNFVAALKAKFPLDLNFRFVQSSLNPADLLTRGLTVGEFSTKFQFWHCGPEFLRESFPPNWPESNLECLSAENQNLVSCSAFNERAILPVLNVNDYS